jgi:putative chitinase
MIDKKLYQPILDACVALDVKDTFLIKAIIANAYKECGLVPQEENLNYSRTSNDRIRSIFGTRVSGLSDAELNKIKSTPKQFAEVVYGKGNALGRSMGNLQDGDGWTYRGRGYIQITGRNNYKHFGDLTGFNLIQDPDLLINDKNVSAMVTVTFVKSGLKKTTFSSQAEADRAVTQVIGGNGLSLDRGYGAELLTKVGKYSTNLEV